ncbi:MAG: hypothetical protein K0Q50_1907 [Vampirovibrio sp.]|nr:hypothetical protein [Vampirovibrio sp.]
MGFRAISALRMMLKGEYTMNLTAPVVIGLMHQFHKQKHLLKAAPKQRPSFSTQYKPDAFINHPKPSDRKAPGLFNLFRRLGTDYNARQFLHHLNNSL